MDKKSSSRKEIVNWDAVEYLQTEKNAGWYVALAIISLGLIALSIWLQWWTFTALIVFLRSPSSFILFARQGLFTTA